MVVLVVVGNLGVEQRDVAVGGSDGIAAFIVDVREPVGLRRAGLGVYVGTMRADAGPDPVADGVVKQRLDNKSRTDADSQRPAGSGDGGGTSHERELGADAGTGLDRGSLSATQCRLTRNLRGGPLASGLHGVLGRGAGGTEGRLAGFLSGGLPRLLTGSVGLLGRVLDGCRAVKAADLLVVCDFLGGLPGPSSVGLTGLGQPLSDLRLLELVLSGQQGVAQLGILLEVGGGDGRRGDASQGVSNVVGVDVVVHTFQFGKVPPVEQLAGGRLIFRRGRSHYMEPPLGGKRSRIRSSLHCQITRWNVPLGTLDQQLSQEVTEHVPRRVRR